MSGADIDADHAPPRSISWRPLMCGVTIGWTSLSRPFDNRLGMSAWPHDRCESAGGATAVRLL